MRKWLLDHVLPPVIVGLIVVAMNLYVDVQVMKREFALLREEVADLWQQTNEQLQEKKP